MAPMDSPMRDFREHTRLACGSRRPRREHWGKLFDAGRVERHARRVRYPFELETKNRLVTPSSDQDEGLEATGNELLNMASFSHWKIQKTKVCCRV